ncbi:hypothetical protein H5410_006024, partial [Solanum commersonii]
MAQANLDQQLVVGYSVNGKSAFQEITSEHHIVYAATLDRHSNKIGIILLSDDTRNAISDSDICKTVGKIKKMFKMPQQQVAAAHRVQQQQRPKGVAALSRTSSPSHSSQRRSRFISWPAEIADMRGSSPARTDIWKLLL